MKITEIKAKTRKYQSLDQTFFLVDGPIVFTWGGEEIKPEEIEVNVNPNWDYTAEFDMKIDSDGIQKLLKELDYDVLRVS